MAYKSYKKKKIKRKRRVFSKDRTRILKGAGLVLLAAAIITGGYFTAKFVMESPDPAPSESIQPTGTDGADATSPTQTVQPTETQPGQTPADARLRAFTLPAALLADTAALDAAVAGAVGAGFNAVVIDLKPEDGYLRWQSAVVDEKQECIAEDALSKEQLTAAVTRLKSAGLVPVARLCAFKDARANQLSDGKITPEKGSSSTWYDGKYGLPTSKPWLNPYAPAAHEYLIGLAAELDRLGLPALLVDGVQFPDKEALVYYGDDGWAVTYTRQQILEKFITDLTAAVNCRVIHSMPGLAAMGEETRPFGANPITFGAATVAPNLMPSTLGARGNGASPYEIVKEAAAQIKQRVAFLDGDAPGVMPWVQGDGYTAAQVAEQLRALTETDADTGYILHRADGNYSFGEYT